MNREGAESKQGKVGRASLPAHSAESILPPDCKCAVFDGYERRLPHWRLTGATYFVTWRLFPAQPELSPDERGLVVEALKHFDGERYHLLAFVVMNDHVHVLVQPLFGFALEAITHTWKSFTANRAQRLHKRKGRVWQDESFDRVVRDEAEFQEKLYYMLNNPFQRWPGLTHYLWMGVHGMLEDLFRDRSGGQGRPTH